MTDKKEIVQIDVNEICEHPRQAEIYGETQVDSQFVETIKTRGILQPLLITPNRDLESDAAYIAIAGHRRLKGAVEAGLNTVPCEIKYYENFSDSYYDLVISNKQREKTKEQKTKEINELQQILRQLSKNSDFTNDSDDDENENSGIPEQSGIGKLTAEMLELLKQLESSNGDTTLAIANQLNLSRSETERIIALCNDDYQQRWLDKVSAMGLSPENQREIIGDWETARQLYYNGEATLNEAYKGVLEMKKGTEKALKPKKKEEKPKKEKKVKSHSPFICPHCQEKVKFEDVQKYVKSLKS